MRLGEPGWKDRYYQHKLGVGLADDEKRREVAAAYDPRGKHQQGGVDAVLRSPLRLPGQA